MEPWNQLPGKVVMVTGASSGLGREFCLNLAKAGCYIIAAARSVNKLNSLCNEINEINTKIKELSLVTKAVAVELDVSSNENDISEAVRTSWNAYGRIDVLINNAGVRGSITSVIDISEKEWEWTMKTNLTGAWLVAKCVMERMIKDGIARSIVNISSIGGLNRVITPGGAAYYTSKAALNTLTNVMALEAGKYQIRVNSIAPGFFKSDITEDIFKKEWLKNDVWKTVPLRTLGETDPGLTSLIKYLIHDSSCYVSGNVFVVDSGYIIPGFPLFSSL
ncbi:3-oxoacyl-[acyl-carrier-protein] reductase FabG-like [Impatiens glandulifera]|uniref:3-oxoacyl-[acyl-carrier-protein] reductase FabG-like n=1 Tax=Impatiens glandulifera TaxID=253017 RepID=UPI001FB18947|nr:3-oxoacyl-[acyl-carrier-protein] reductase FabG-like [Impatiens glandulifera]